MGPLKKDFTCVGESELGSHEDLMNVLRIRVLGCSICPVLRGSGGVQFLTNLWQQVGPPNKDVTCVGGSELGS